MATNRLPTNVDIERGQWPSTTPERRHREMTAPQAGGAAEAHERRPTGPTHSSGSEPDSMVFSVHTSRRCARTVSARARADDWPIVSTSTSLGLVQHPTESAINAVRDAFGFVLCQPDVIPDGIMYIAPRCRTGEVTCMCACGRRPRVTMGSVGRQHVLRPSEPDEPDEPA